MKRLIVTEAAKNLADSLKRVYHQRESFELVKNGTRYARLVPITGAHVTLMSWPMTSPKQN